MSLLSVQNVSHRFGTLTVLDGINLTLEPGHIVGLLGPNGCGKTTLLKIIAGLILDYKGQVAISNGPVGPESKAIVSYLPEKTYLSDWMKPRDTIKLFSDFYADFDAVRARQLIDRFALPEKSVRSMSKGMQEKLQLILVMCRRAKLYLLDEPLGGIDPASRVTMLEIILSSMSQDSSIIISTHLIHDLESTIDRAWMIKNAQLLVDSDVDTLRAQTGRSVEDYFKEVYSC